ncbi:phytoene desaturase family protein [Neorhodopirellula pilleata]|uniref:Phytoene desaturase (Neurosporene-forming) n=1 Tax=Neorhodopirellula pilleata TaxID=2714738 RepID=A0A5C6A119_9BACT|nr:NAD(P)/FAD-dependent oxidoreductase [Neorhodopirellula pilleata]TWT93116.1 Phytoene desaturase (neurosporene-forming) [Neorhodopirellula pilleata]
MKTTNNDQSSYDAIVIGSGMGGLTVASLLAQLGKKRVLVLERHFKLGGYTHSFRRGKYEWDVGVHYVGEMHEGSLSRKVMDLVTGKQVLWHRCGSVVERLHFPEGQFEYPDNPEHLRERLIEKFPEERRAIEKYFRDVKKCQNWIARYFFAKMMPLSLQKVLTWPGRKLAMTITDDYLKTIRSPFLRAILTAQWPDFGAKPSESAFAYHSAVTGDFFNGSFYPIGGAQEIADSVKEIVTEAGGDCLVNHPVQEILVKDGKACGVKTIHKGKEFVFTAPIIVSNAGAVTTFKKLVPEGYCEAEKEKAGRLKQGTSAVALFLGLNDDPRNHGFDDANYWFFSSLDHSESAKPEDVLDIRGGFLSFGSLRNPEQQQHTAQIISFSHYDAWEKFADKPWLRRGEEYDRLKDELTEALLSLAEKHVPKIRDLVDYAELSTPVTFEKFSGHAGGMVYGQLCDPDRLDKDQWRVATSLPNLYLSGCDIGSPGINGSMMASIFTAVKILGFRRLPEIIQS